MRRNGVTLLRLVIVKRSVDCWQKLIRAQEAAPGEYIVTVHNGQLAKLPAVDRETNVSEMPHRITGIRGLAVSREYPPWPDVFAPPSAPPSSTAHLPGDAPR